MARWTYVSPHFWGTRIVGADQRDVPLRGQLQALSNPVVAGESRVYQAHAYASTRGSAPALRTPVSGSTTIPAFEPMDHAGLTRSL